MHASDKVLKIVSCYYGNQLSGVYTAPKSGEAYFFSNNEGMKAIAEREGWKFKYDPATLSCDSRISSLQSKKVKFLQFDLGLIGLTERDSVLYFDHKFNVQDAHISLMRSFPMRALLIRNTPKEKLSITDEITDALPQSRYRENMPETIEWLSEMYEKGYSPNTRIMNTGLIYYKNPRACSALLKMTYEQCWRLGQPECQIIWALYSQDYECEIQRADWSLLDIEWRTPIE